MAYTDDQVKERASQILKEKGDTAEARAQIAREAQQAGVSSGQLARSLGGGWTSQSVEQAASDVGQAFSGGLLSSSRNNGVDLMGVARDLQSGKIDRDQAQQQLSRSVALPGSTATTSEAIPKGARGLLSDAFTSYTGRELTPEQLDLRMGQMQQGMFSFDQALSGIPMSEEAMGITYEDPFQQVISDLYEKATGRAFSQEGIEKYGAQFKGDVLETGNAEEALQQYVNLVQTTPEFYTKQATDLYTQVYGAVDPTQIEGVASRIQEQVNSGVDLATAMQTVGTGLQNVKNMSDTVNTIQSDNSVESTKALSNLFVTAYQTGQKFTPEQLQNLLGEEQPNEGLEDPYTKTAVAYVLGKGQIEFYDAMNRGDTETALRLADELQNPEEYYANNAGADPLKEFRSTLLTRDEYYGKGSPQNRGFIEKVIDDVGGFDNDGGIFGSIEAFAQNPIEALDRWKDMPAAKIASFFVPGGAALLSAYNTLDSGKNLSTGQVLALAVSAANYADALGFTPETVESTAAMEDIGSVSQLSNSNIVGDVAQGISELGQQGQEVLSAIEAPVSTLVQSAVDKLGGADFLISKAGSYATDEFIQGVYSGATAAAISKVTGEGNPILKGLEELKGTEILSGMIPSMPQGKITEWLASVEDEARAAGEQFEDWYRSKGFDPGQISREVAKVEDWFKENIFDPGIITEPLADLEDWARKNIDLSGIEDFIIETGDEIATVIDEITTDLPDISATSYGTGGGVQQVPFEELAFNAKKGRQGMLPYDLTFYYDEPLLSKELLAKT